MTFTTQCGREEIILDSDECLCLPGIFSEEESFLAVLLPLRMSFMCCTISPIATEKTNKQTRQNKKLNLQLRLVRFYWTKYAQTQLHQAASFFIRIRIFLCFCLVVPVPRHIKSSLNNTIGPHLSILGTTYSFSTTEAAKQQPTNETFTFWRPITSWQNWQPEA